MQKKNFTIDHSTVSYYIDAKFSELGKLADIKNTVLVTDDHVFNHREKKFSRWNTIVLKPGEKYKVQETADAVISQLLDAGADRHTLLVGVGGGVITDLTGYVASVYMRGIRSGFVPTTLLAMVDAAIGGKNGVNAGRYKNMVGTIHQPEFIFFDHSFLKTLPDAEWENGFAEVIKHAAIRDAAMFRELEINNLAAYQRKKALLASLVQRNVMLKTKIVMSDSLETGERKLLNFGHTLGHALENNYRLSHGEAISIGMSFAALLSNQYTGFKQADRLIELLNRYELPTGLRFDKEKVFETMKRDKKKNSDGIDFILLERTGKGIIRKIPFTDLYEAL
jgi:3-dehydroquinate synthase